jgi:hypothetical protein
MYPIYPTFANAAGRLSGFFYLPVTGDAEPYPIGIGAVPSVSFGLLQCNQPAQGLCNAVQRLGDRSLDFHVTLPKHDSRFLIPPPAEFIWPDEPLSEAELALPDLGDD